MWQVFYDSFDENFEGRWVVSQSSDYGGTAIIRIFLSCFFQWCVGFYRMLRFNSIAWNSRPNVVRYLAMSLPSYCLGWKRVKLLGINWSEMVRRVFYKVIVIICRKVEAWEEWGPWRLWFVSKWESKEIWHSYWPSREGWSQGWRFGTAIRFAVAEWAWVRWCIPEVFATTGTCYWPW